MNEALMSLALFAAEQLLKYAPKLYAEFARLVSQKNVTVEEIRARRTAIVEQTFEDLVPHSELPPETTPPTPDSPSAPPGN